MKQYKTIYSGDIIEDTKVLMQFYNEKNLKLKKLAGRMKTKNYTLGRNFYSLRPKLVYPLIPYE